MHTLIHLVRHGLVHNPKQVLYGRLPRFGLSDEGQRQAAAAGEYLSQRNIAALYCSPLLRTRQTAHAILAHHPQLKCKLEPRIIEVFVPFEGMPLHDMEARNWNVYDGNQPPYETERDVFQRFQHAIQNARAKHSGREVVFVSHGDCITFTMLWAQRRPIAWQDKGGHTRFGLADDYPQTASITTLTFETDDAQDIPKLAYVRPY